MHFEYLKVFIRTIKAPQVRALGLYQVCSSTHTHTLFHLRFDGLSVLCTWYWNHPSSVLKKMPADLVHFFCIGGLCVAAWCSLVDVFSTESGELYIFDVVLINPDLGLRERTTRVIAIKLTCHCPADAFWRCLKRRVIIWWRIFSGHPTWC